MRALVHGRMCRTYRPSGSGSGRQKPARRLMRGHYTGLKGSDRLIKASRENLRSQIDQLRTHPSVAVLLRPRNVSLPGWVYSISTGDVWVYDFDSERFTSLLEDAFPSLKA